MSEAARTNNSLFLNTVKRFAKEELGRDGIVRAAAPSGTAATEIHYTFSYICMLARANVAVAL